MKTLKEDLEALLAGTQAVGTMLLNEGLDDVAQSTLGEQVCDVPGLYSLYMINRCIIYFFCVWSVGES